MRSLLLLAAAVAATPAMAQPHAPRARGSIQVASRTATEVASAPADAPIALQALGPFAACDAAIQAAVKPPVRVPDKLVPAIARVESGRLDPATGRVRPWPWTINVEGAGYFYDTKEQVISAVQDFQAKGIKSIDVGCMQVNLMHHPHAFGDLQEAFDPAANARYAVRFLTSLYQLSKDWNLATAWYHSMDPDRGEEYQRLVFGRVMTPMGGTGAVAGKPVGPYGEWPPRNTQFAAIPPVNFQFAAGYASFKPQGFTLGGAPMSVPAFGTMAASVTPLPTRR